MRVFTLAAAFLVLTMALPAFLIAGGPAATPTITPPAGGAPGMPLGGMVPGGMGPGGMRGRGPVSATQPAQNRGHSSRHTDFLQIARRGAGNIDILFVGDSITDGWLTTGRQVWDQNFEPLKPANFGISGDTTQGALWRMQNGELEGFKAKLIILMLGTNNLGSSPNADIAEGDRLIVEEFKKRQPQAKVLILGIFPRGASATDSNRQRIKDINTILATFADNKQVFYMDIGDKFLAPDGTLPRDIMADALHPNARGYQIWTDAMLPKVKELLQP